MSIMSDYRPLVDMLEFTAVSGFLMWGLVTGLSVGLDKIGDYFYNRRAVSRRPRDQSDLRESPSRRYPKEP
jgi:hypothetical protein